MPAITQLTGNMQQETNNHDRDREGILVIRGISHITLIVEDLEKTANLLRAVFDAQEIYSSGERQFSLSREKFFLIGDIWLCIMQGQSLAERTYNHIAFEIPDDEFDLYVSRIQAAGCEIRSSRPRVAGEGHSVYFYDFDNHLFELHAGNLRDRLSAYSES